MARRSNGSRYSDSLTVYSSPSYQGHGTKSDNPNLQATCVAGVRWDCESGELWYRGSVVAEVASLPTPVQIIAMLNG